jgi:hypothetical protein
MYDLHPFRQALNEAPGLLSFDLTTLVAVGGGGF